jgi:hypothetical protein
MLLALASVAPFLGPSPFGLIINESRTYVVYQPLRFNSLNFNLCINIGYKNQIRLLQHEVAGVYFCPRCGSGPFTSPVTPGADHERSENRFRHELHVRILLMGTYRA